MSLINDALKKAQRERSGETTPTQPPPATTPPPPAAPAPSAPAAASSGFKGLPIIVAVAIVVVGFLGWRMFAPSKQPETVATTIESAPAGTAPATTPAPVASQPEPQPVASAPVEQKPEPVATTQASSSAPEKPAEVATTTPAVAAPAVEARPEPKPEPPPVVAVTIDEAPAVAVNIPPPSNTTSTAPQELPATVITIPEGAVGTSPSAPLISLRQQDPRILAYLDAVRVNGIRPSPDDPKALMNNRVFRIGDVVDRELNLRLTAIAPNKLTFEDDRGMPYVKSF